MPAIMKPYILPAVIAWFDAVQKPLWVQSFSTFQYCIR